MISFTSTTDFIPIWNDNEKNENPIKIELKPLNTSNYYTLLGISNAIYTKGEKGKDGTVDVEKLVKYIPDLSRVYQENVEIKANLLMDGKLMTISQVINSNVFLGLVLEIFYKLIDISIVNRGVKKK